MLLTSNCYNRLEAMPLDDLARRYADELLEAKRDELLAVQRQKSLESREFHSSHGLARSSNLVTSEGKIQAEFACRLSEARAETLLNAYELVGIPFDESALHEVTNEISAFIATQQRYAISNISRFVEQTFGGRATPDILACGTGAIETAMNSILAKITRDLRIRRYETVLDERKTRKVYAAGLGKEWDVFISHASEDKEEFARPLADALKRLGLRVWFDEATLKVGDSLRRAVDHGLANSRYGIVVLSHSFFNKKWPQDELDGLVASEVGGLKVILPVWHKITADEVRRYSPMLAGRLATSSDAGLEVVVSHLRVAMGLV